MLDILNEFNSTVKNRFIIIQIVLLTKKEFNDIITVNKMYNIKLSFLT